MLKKKVLQDGRVGKILISSLSIQHTKCKATMRLFLYPENKDHSATQHPRKGKLGLD